MRCADRGRAEAANAAAISFAVAAALVAACTTTPAGSGLASEAAGASAQPTPTATGPMPIRVGTAEPGSWTTTAFEPTLRFTIKSDGWLFFFPDEDDEMAVGKSGDIELTGSRVASVVDPDSHKAARAPEDLVAWLASHPSLRAGTPQPATVGGVDGRAIEVTNDGTRDVDIFAFDAGNLRVSAGTQARIWVLPIDGPDLVFCGFAPQTSFDDALPELQSVVDSMEIDAS